MTNSQIMAAKKFIEFEMANNPQKYTDAFDLAVECCSELDLWEEDQSIPNQVCIMCEAMF